MMLAPLDGHPVPLDQDSIDEVWRRHDRYDEANAPSVDDAHEDYVETIAEWGEWHVFRPRYPFGLSDVVFWNRGTGEGFVIEDDEGSWHSMVNLFAEIVESEGDCRDAEYLSTTLPSGCYDQRCRECGDSWVIG